MTSFAEYCDRYDKPKNLKSRCVYLLGKRPAQTFLAIAAIIVTPVAPVVIHRQLNKVTSSVIMLPAEGCEGFNFDARRKQLAWPVNCKAPGLGKVLGFGKN